MAISPEDLKKQNDEVAQLQDMQVQKNIELEEKQLINEHDEEKAIEIEEVEETVILQEYVQELEEDAEDLEEELEEDEENEEIADANAEMQESSPPVEEALKEHAEQLALDAEKLKAEDAQKAAALLESPTPTPNPF